MSLQSTTKSSNQNRSVVERFVAALNGGERVYVSGNTLLRVAGLELLFEQDFAAQHDIATMKWLISQLKENASRQHEVAETINELVKAAGLFEKTVLGKYWFWQRSNTFDLHRRELNTLVKLAHYSKLLNIPYQHLLDNPQDVRFIKKNFLHKRIESTYVKRGLGPRVYEGQLQFPVNVGATGRPDVEWVATDAIPVDKEGRVKWAYGPYGYEKGVHPEMPEMLAPVKLVDMDFRDIRPDNVIVEMVTSLPSKSLLKKLLKPASSFGHSWIRVYEPKIKENGTYTGQRYEYSFGACTGSYKIHSPDVREFMNDKQVSVRTVIPLDQWNEDLKPYAERIMKQSTGSIDEPGLRALLRRFKRGTCVNFANHIFEVASHPGRKEDGRNLPADRVPQGTFETTMPLQAKIAAAIATSGIYRLGMLLPGTLRKVARKAKSGGLPGVAAQSVKQAAKNGGHNGNAPFYIGKPRILTDTLKERRKQLTVRPKAVPITAIAVDRFRRLRGDQHGHGTLVSSKA